MDDVDRQIIDRLLAANNPEDKRQLLEAEAGRLLDPAIEKELRAMAETASQDEQRRILAHATLLAACRANGIGATFNAMLAEDWRNRMRALVLWLATNFVDLSKLLQFIEERPDIALSDELEKEVTWAIDWAENMDPASLSSDARMDSRAFSTNLRAVRNILADCRRDGVAKALERWSDVITVLIDRSLNAETIEALKQLHAPSSDDADPERRVDLCRWILHSLDREKHEVVWAYAQYRLGLALRQLGSREADVAHVQDAVKALAAALDVYTPTRFPREQRIVQKVLDDTLAALEAVRTDLEGLPVDVIAALREVDALASGDKTSSSNRAPLERRIEIYRRILRDLDGRQEYELGGAQVQYRLSKALIALFTLDGKVAHLREALTVNDAALRVFTQLGMRRSCARTQHDRAVISVELGEFVGDSAYLEEAIRLYQDILDKQANMCAQARDGLTHQRARMERAFTLTNYGSALRLLGKFRADPKLLANAVVAHRDALAEIDSTNASDQWVTPEQREMTQNNLGHALVELGELTVDPSLLEEAVRLFNVAGAGADRGTAFIEKQNGLGNALASLADIANDLSLLPKAIDAYNKALAAMSAMVFPMDWAMTHYNLGNALVTLAQHTRDPGKLREAIDAYDEALREYASVDDWRDWAMVQNSRGNALTRLARHTEDPDFHSQAIEALTAALKQREGRTMEWAQTQSNLGNALLAFAEHARNFGFPSSVARDFSKRALAACEAALRNFSANESRWPWAVTQCHRGKALALLGETSGEPSHLRAAVDAYNAALEVFTHERSPLMWASTQNNRARALLTLGERTGSSACLEEAEAAFLSALEEFTPAQRLLDYINSSMGLGGLFLHQRKWTAAIKTFAPLFDLARPLVQSESSLARQRALLRLFDGAGDALAYCYLQRDQPAEALDAATRVRTVLLDTAFVSGAAGNGSPLHDARRQWLAAQYNVEQTAASLGKPTSPDAKLHYNRAKEAAQAAFDVYCKRLSESGISASETYDLETLERAVPAGGALVLPLVCAAGAAVIVLRHCAARPDVLHLNDLTLGSLNELRAKYYTGYAIFRQSISQKRDLDTASSAWNAVLRSTLVSLGHDLLAPLDRYLKKLGVEADREIVFMVRGRMAMFPLAAAPIEDGRVFLEEWIVSYAPSPKALIASRKRANERRGGSGSPPTLLAVTDPTGDLGIDQNPAVVGRASGFIKELKNDRATVEAVRQALPGTRLISFYCHGQWDQTDLDRCGLVMSGERLLTVPMLRQLDLSASRFAMLAACESGFTNRIAVDEYEGMPGALIDAGVPAVSASLWPVEKEATERLVRRCFECLCLGDAPAVALRKAQLGLLHAGATSTAESPNQTDWPRDYSAPYFWAGFTLEGS
jgi:CHAT domain-containing protein